MIYYLPLEIKGRGFHIAALHEHPPQNLSPAKQYVLGHDGDTTILFHLDHDTRFIAKGGFSKDLYWERVTIDFKEVPTEDSNHPKRNQLTLTLTTVSGDKLPVRNNPVTNNASQQIVSKFENNKLEIGLKVQLLGEFEVVLRAETLNTQVSNQFIVHVASRTVIWDVALDFGSEASQLSKRPAKGGNILPIPLIDGFKSFYTDKANVAEKDFLQYDKSGFFRSIFFANEGENALLNTTDAPNTEHELIPMLNDSSKSATFKFNKLLPTVKLAALGSQDDESLRLKGGNETIGKLAPKIYQKLIFNFLHTACNSIKKERDLYIRFKLLIPNVFKQHDITQLVQLVERHAAAFKQKFPIYRLKGIEINTISESDAAFAGYILSPGVTLRTNGKYAIIDAGRGTTDYSVVEILDTKKAVSLYRGGFVGAGAMLTFAFMDTVITTILVDHLGKTLTPSERETFFKEKICGKGVELKWQLEFLGWIEALKVRHEQGIENPDGKLLIATQPNIKNTPLNILNDLLKKFVKEEQEFFIKDRFGFIKNTTQALANRIFEDFQKLPDEFSKLDGIILSGRGFLFEPLQVALKQKFEKTTKNIIFSQEPKKICMDGAFTRSHFNGNCNMEGIPYAVSFLNNQQQLLAPPPTAKPPTAIDKIWKWFNQADEDAEPTQTRKNYYQDIHKFLKGGSRCVVDKGHRIFISGHLYEHDLKLTKDDEINLFFTGEGFLIRTKNQAAELKDTAGRGINEEFRAKTLFPTIIGAKLPLGTI